MTYRRNNHPFCHYAMSHYSKRILISFSANNGVTFTLYFSRYQELLLNNWLTTDVRTLTSNLFSHNVMSTMPYSDNQFVSILASKLHTWLTLFGLITHKILPQSGPALTRNIRVSASSDFTCHVSRVTFSGFHVSRVTCHVSPNKSATKCHVEKVNDVGSYWTSGQYGNRKWNSRWERVTTLSLTWNMDDLDKWRVTWMITWLMTCNIDDHVTNDVWDNHVTNDV